MRPSLPSRRGGSAALLSRCLAAAALAIFLVGCSTGIPPATYCYQVAGATVHAVDTGMSIAGDLYRDGKVTEAQKAKLIAAHDVYRPAAQAAVAGCKAVQAQGDADKILAQLRIASDKVLEALVKAGVL